VLENVLIDAQGYPVLIDFGFAKKLGVADGKAELTFTLCGTPGYLPPECCLSLGHSYAADHWSFGILAYEMLTGEVRQIGAL
jgi:protein kinase A